MWKVIKIKTKALPNYKVREVQFNLSSNFYAEFDFRIDFTESFGNIFAIWFNIANLFKISIIKDKECDHAGLRIEIKLFIFELLYNRVDQRHWDYDKEDWENYDEIYIQKEKPIDKLKPALELLKECSGFIDVARFELGEEFDEGNLEAKVNMFLQENNIKEF